MNFIQTKEEDMDANTNPNRITFSSGSISPAATPDFQYVVESLDFDRLIFIASVDSASIDAACKKIYENWPDARIRRIEAGTDYLSSHHIGPIYGASNVLKASWFRRVARRLPLIGFFLD